jgi:hypothetical protein
MIKLNSNKKNTIKFQIDISDGENVDGRFRLMHEGIEYGFPVHIFGNGNKAEVVIPALAKIMPELKKGTIFEAKLEFVSGSDYDLAWADKAEIEVPRVSVKVKEEVKVSVEDEQILGCHLKVTDEKESPEMSVSTPVIEVSDDVWAKSKPRPVKALTEDEQEKVDAEYADRRAEVNKILAENGDGTGFSKFFSKE